MRWIFIFLESLCFMISWIIFILCNRPVFLFLQLPRHTDNNAFDYLVFGFSLLLKKDWFDQKRRISFMVFSASMVPHMEKKHKYLIPLSERYFSLKKSVGSTFCSRNMANIISFSNSHHVLNITLTKKQKQKNLEITSSVWFLLK